MSPPVTDLLILQQQQPRTIGPQALIFDVVLFVSATTLIYLLGTALLKRLFAPRLGNTKDSGLSITAYGTLFARGIAIINAVSISLHLIGIINVRIVYGFLGVTALIVIWHIPSRIKSSQIG